MTSIATKQDRLRALRRRVRWHRRWVIALLVVEVLAVSGFVVLRGGDEGSGTPEVVGP